MLLAEAAVSIASASLTMVSITRGPAKNQFAGDKLNQNEVRDHIWHSAVS
jgi:hypothetical protein